MTSVPGITPPERSRVPGRGRGSSRLFAGRHGGKDELLAERREEVCRDGDAMVGQGTDAPVGGSRRPRCRPDAHGGRSLVRPRRGGLAAERAGPCLHDWPRRGTRADAVTIVANPPPEVRRGLTPVPAVTEPGRDDRDPPRIRAEPRSTGPVWSRSRHVDPPGVGDGGPYPPRSRGRPAPGAGRADRHGGLATAPRRAGSLRPMSRPEAARCRAADASPRERRSMCRARPQSHSRRVACLAGGRVTACPGPRAAAFNAWASSTRLDRAAPEATGEGRRR